MGPWTTTGLDLNPARAINGKLVKQRTIQAQENFVVTVPAAVQVVQLTDERKLEPTFVYTGDRWDSAPDRQKSHDFQYWQPLVWNACSPPSIAPLHWIDSFTLNLPQESYAPSALKTEVSKKVQAGL